MKKIISIIIIFFPWFIKRKIYCILFKYNIHPKSSIGLSWVYVDTLNLSENARIGHLNVIKGLESLSLEPYAKIGNLNWITAYPKSTQSLHFQHQILEREPKLIIGEHAAITNRHLIDCSNKVTIQRFTTLAGFKSTLLTHSIDLKENRQSSKPIVIGAYCFIGTGCIILGGTSIPDFSVVAAGSTVNKNFDQTHALYGGSPAKFIKSLENENYKYFSRNSGFVY